MTSKPRPQAAESRLKKLKAAAKARAAAGDDAVSGEDFAAESSTEQTTGGIGPTTASHEFEDIPTLSSPKASFHHR